MSVLFIAEDCSDREVLAVKFTELLVLFFRSDSGSNVSFAAMRGTVPFSLALLRFTGVV